MYTRYPSEEDRLLAREIELAERDAMVSRDEELAHQMQLRENAYLTPRLVLLYTSPTGGAYRRHSIIH